MAAEPRVILDITRTLRRVRHAHASGIDRVERAYLRWALERPALFLARSGNDWAITGLEGAREILSLAEGAPGRLDLAARLRPDRDRRLREAETCLRRVAHRRGRLADLLPSGGVYLTVGHVNTDPATFAAIRAAGPRPVAMLHDLIPLEHPDFATEAATEEAADRLAALTLAALVLTNSTDTAERVRDQAMMRGLALPRVAPLPLGVDLAEPEGAPPPKPYFVVLGTIEPRKNHALLLDIWARFWEQGRRDIHLHVVGRRGWLNEEVFGTLDSAPMRGVTVHEHGDMSDGEVAGLLAGARALLFPSLAEGFGLPLAEALALGTPVIASDLPALREVGGTVPTFLGARDRGRWQAAILEHLAPQPRIEAWQPPRWETHFADLDTLLTEFLTNRA